MEYRFSEKHIKRNPIEQSLLFSMVVAVPLAFVSQMEEFQSLSWYPVPFIICFFAFFLRAKWKQKHLFAIQHLVTFSDREILFSNSPETKAIDLSSLTRLDVVMKKSTPVRIVGMKDNGSLFELRNYENMTNMLAEIKKIMSCEVKIIKGY